MEPKDVSLLLKYMRGFAAAPLWIQLQLQDGDAGQFGGAAGFCRAGEARS